MREPRASGWLEKAPTNPGVEALGLGGPPQQALPTIESGAVSLATQRAGTHAPPPLTYVLRCQATGEPLPWRVRAPDGRLVGSFETEQEARAALLRLRGAP